MNIHDRARALAAQKQIPLSDAYAELAKRRKRKPYGVLHPTQADRSAFSHVERPRFWWESQ